MPGGEIPGVSNRRNLLYGESPAYGTVLREGGTLRVRRGEGGIGKRKGKKKFRAADPGAGSRNEQEVPIARAVLVHDYKRGLSEGGAWL